MENDPPQSFPSLGYEFAREEEARTAASNLDRRYTENELSGLRIYRVRWNGNYLVEATFTQNTPEARLQDARALLAESGIPVHPDDLTDYKQATDQSKTLPEWLRRFFS